MTRKPRGLPRRNWLSFAAAMGVGFLVPDMPAQAQDSDFKNGVLLFQKQKYQDAVRSFDSSISKQGRKPTALYYEALCLLYLGDSGRAKSLFLEIVHKFPSSQEARQARSYLQAPAPASRQTAKGTRLAGPSQSEFESLPEEVSIPFRKGRGGHLFVDGELNGRSMPMIFDTGAESCAFGQNHLDGAGISEKPTMPGGYSMGVGGMVEVKGMMASIKAGNLKRNLQISVQPNLPVAPLLGQPFYQGYAYEIDNSAGLVRMHKKGAGRSSQGFDSIEIPYTLEGKEMVVDVEIEGKSIPMYFDTGAHGIALSQTHMLQLGLRPPEEGYMVGTSRGIGGTTSMIQFNVKTVRLGPIQKTNFPISVIQSPLPHPLLGQSFFGDRKFTIDQENRVIRFSR